MTRKNYLMDMNLIDGRFAMGLQAMIKAIEDMIDKGVE